MKLTNKEAADVIMRIQIQLGRMNGKMLLSSALLKAVEVLRKAPEWIPVSERLPEEEGDYLITLYRYNVTIDHFVNGKFVFFNNYAIAWQPLPEPYKEEAADE